MKNSRLAQDKQNLKVTHPKGKLEFNFFVLCVRRRELHVGYAAL